MTLEEEREFIDTIQNEIISFKEEMLKKSKEQIYDDYYKIHAMEELSEFLIDNADEFDRSGFPKNKILEYLYWQFMETDYDFTQEDLNYFIKEENKSYKLTHSDIPLAQRLDDFYADYSPYDRYDATGSFSSKYDPENIGINQVKDCLSSKEGCYHIKEFLDEVIKTDERTEFIERAIILKNDIEKEIQNFESDNEM